MSITLTNNYKEVLSSEVLEIVNDLVENGYELSDVLNTLDYFGEEYYENLKEIIEFKDDIDTDNSELHEFVEQFSIDDLEYFEKYRDTVEFYSEDAVNAYVKCCGIECIESFSKSYEGEYASVKDFVDYILDSMGEEVPSWLCIDAEATWNCSLHHDYFEENGFYFRNV
jgi:hypothetical protein